MTRARAASVVAGLNLMLALGACGDSPRDGTSDTVVPTARAAGATATSRSPSITVCGEQRGATFVYHYTVQNGPRAPSRAIEIGFGAGREADSTDAPDGGGELTRVPIGAPIHWEGDGRLSAPGVTSPARWFAEAKRVEETAGHYIAWYADSNEVGIPPGAALTGFSVTVAGRDTAYEGGHWRMNTDSGGDYIGRLRRALADSGCGR